MEYSAINFEPLKEKRKHPILENIAIFGSAAALIVCVVYLIMFLWSAKHGHVHPAQAIIAFGSMILTLVLLKWSDAVMTKSVGPTLFIDANGFTREDVRLDWEQVNNEAFALSGRLQNKKLRPRDFMVGNSFSGNLVDKPFHAFELIKTTEDVLNANKAVEARPYMLILAFNLNRDLPHIYISNRKLDEGGKSAFGYFEENWLFQQPGNFKAINKDMKNYAIYAPDKLEIEALTLLSPTVLDAIANAGPGADIEFLNGRLLIYQYIGWLESRPKAYQTAFALASSLLPAMARTLTTMRYDATGKLSAEGKDIYHDAPGTTGDYSRSDNH